MTNTNREQWLLWQCFNRVYLQQNVKGVYTVKWEEVRKLCPNRFVKMQILKSHICDDVRYIDDMSIIKAFDDSREATRELVRAKDDILVYHTGREKIEVPIIQLFGLRGAI